MIKRSIESCVIEYIQHDDGDMMCQILLEYSWVWIFDWLRKRPCTIAKYYITRVCLLYETGNIGKPYHPPSI